jgi:hypothetical protein
MAFGLDHFRPSRLIQLFGKLSFALFDQPSVCVGTMACDESLPRSLFRLLLELPTHPLHCLRSSLLLF